MRSAELRGLRARWTTPDGRALALEASRWLAGLGPRPPQVGEHNGRADLRGLTFPDAQRIGTVRGGGLTFAAIGGFPEFLDAQWHSLDLSGSAIQHARFVRSELRDCVFGHANLGDWRLWNTTVLGCSFVRADLRDGALGTTRDSYGGTNTWIGVCFDGANLAGAFFNDAVLRSCTFRKTKLKRVRFGYTTFEDVIFTGVLDAVRFEARSFPGTVDPGPMTRVDFSDALFRDRYMLGYKFEDVAFAPDVIVLPDFPRVIARALELARSSHDPDERSAISGLEYAADHRSPGTWDSIFVPADFKTWGPEAEASALVRLYERAEVE